MANDGLSVLEGQVLDMVAAGKSPRQIAAQLGIEPGKAAQMAYSLLDKEIITDTDQRRKLQVYRLEKLIEALWERTMRNADRDDVRNVTEIIDKLNVLLALNKEQDEELFKRMHAHQYAAYIDAIMGLLMAFKIAAPELMSEDQWAAWAGDQLESAKERLMLGIEA